MVYDHVAIALDGSPAALTAARYARHIAATCYRVIHVQESGGPLGRFARGDRSPDEERAEITARLASDVRAAMGVESAGDAPTLAFDIRSGDPVDGIVAASAAADLLLLTTRGRGAASRTLFGSVADEITRRATCPTLTVRPDHDLSRPVRVIVALDGGSRAERSLDVAARLAATVACPVVLVHVVDEADLDETPFGRHDPGDGDGDGVGPRADEVSSAIDRATAYLREVETRLEGDGLTVQHRVVIGETIPALVEFADPADIVVVSSRAQTGLRRLVDPSVADNLVRHAPSPVLIVHEGTVAAPDRAERSEAD